VTRVNIDMLDCTTALFLQEPAVKGKPVMVLMEITMNNLLASGALDAADFLARVDLLGSIGFTVIISNYSEFFRLTTYFRRYTKEMIGVALGVNNLIEIFNEKYYENLPGGILESFGRMFRQSVKLYVYPMRAAAYERYVAATMLSDTAPDAVPPPATTGALPAAIAADVLITADNLKVPPHLRHLYTHLLENHYIEGVTGFNPETLHIISRDVLDMIQHGDPAWEAAVPPGVVDTIKQRGLFEHPAAPAQP
jgi:hypothetical protein